KLQQPVPLSAPQGLKVYALPGGTITLPGGQVRDASNNAGLRWDRGITAAGLLRPGQALLFHLWRAGLGDAAPAAAPAAAAFACVTRDSPVLVVDPFVAPDQAPPAPPDWPPFPLCTQDNALPDGWYSYQVSGVDLFGRHSPNSTAGPWFQWAPPPDPRPWYYQDPPGDTQLHAFAVHLLDKLPPPPPTGI